MESIVLGIYLWLKIYFLIDTNVKNVNRNYWSCHFRKKLLKFLQGVNVHTAIKSFSGYVPVYIVIIVVFFLERPSKGSWFWKLIKEGGYFQTIHEMVRLPLIVRLPASFTCYLTTQWLPHQPPIVLLSTWQPSSCCIFYLSHSWNTFECTTMEYEGIRPSWLIWNENHFCIFRLFS